MTDASRKRRTDTASRVIAASPEAVYRAFLEPEAWAKWLPPEGMTGQLLEFEARVGGRYKMALTFSDRSARGKTSDNTDVVEGRFIEIVPQQRVVHLFIFNSDDPSFAGEMRMTWSLSPMSNGTNVSIVCENVPDGISKEDHDTGLRSTLENLAKFLE